MARPERRHRRRAPAGRTAPRPRAAPFTGRRVRRTERRGEVRGSRAGYAAAVRINGVNARLYGPTGSSARRVKARASCADNSDYRPACWPTTEVAGGWSAADPAPSRPSGAFASSGERVVALLRACRGCPARFGTGQPSRVVRRPDSQRRWRSALAGGKIRELAVVVGGGSAYMAARVLQSNVHVVNQRRGK